MYREILRGSQNLAPFSNETNDRKAYGPKNHNLRFWKQIQT